MLALVYVGGISAVYFAPESSEVATWWPAAGISVVLLVLSPRSWWPALAVAIAVSSGLAKLTAGQASPLETVDRMADAMVMRRLFPVRQADGSLRPVEGRP